MTFGYGTQVNPKMTKQDQKNIRDYKALEKEKARLKKLDTLTENIKYCNERLSDFDFISTATPENVKALVIFRLELLKEKETIK